MHLPSIADGHISTDLEKQIFTEKHDKPPVSGILLTHQSTIFTSLVT